MARTRNSDPGRVKTLYYAATPRQRHAKRLVYAYFARLRGVAAAAGQCGLMAMALAAASAGVAAQPEGAASNVPCVACQALSALPAQVFSFPEELAAAPVLVRLPPGTSAVEWLAPLQEIRRRGGQPGLHLTGVPEADDPALEADVATMVVEVGAGNPDRLAFDLKRALTFVRGRRPSATLLIAGPPDVTAALVQRGMDSYVDGFLPVPATIRGPDELLDPDGRPGIRVWRLPPSAEAARAIAAAAAALRAWLPAGLVAVSGRSLTCEGRPLRVMLNPQSLDLVAVSRSCPAP